MDDHRRAPCCKRRSRSRSDSTFAARSPTSERALRLSNSVAGNVGFCTTSAIDIESFVEILRQRLHRDVCRIPTAAGIHDSHRSTEADLRSRPPNGSSCRRRSSAVVKSCDAGLAVRFVCRARFENEVHRDHRKLSLLDHPNFEPVGQFCFFDRAAATISDQGPVLATWRPERRSLPDPFSPLYRGRLIRRTCCRATPSARFGL